MRNALNTALAGGLALILAGCATQRVANTDRVRTNRTTTANTQALTYDTLNLGGTNYISSPIPAGYTAQIKGQTIPRGNVLLYLTPANNPTINGSTYSPANNASFAVNVVYTNGTLIPNMSESLAETGVTVHSQKLETITESTGALSETVTTPSVHFPQKTVSIGGNKLRIVRNANSGQPGYLLFVSNGKPHQRIENGRLDVIENANTYCVFPGQFEKIPQPTPVITKQAQSPIDLIPMAIIGPSN